jgi:branched-chain amino acid transport system substrate-binding protein
LAATGCLVAAPGFGVEAYGGDDSSDSGGGAATASNSVTIYSSYPLQAAGRAQSEAAVNGAELALEDAGGKAADINVTYKPLDDSTAQAGNWTPEQTSADARKAAQGETLARPRKAGASSTSARTTACRPERGRMNAAFETLAPRAWQL